MKKIVLVAGLLMVAAQLLAQKAEIFNTAGMAIGGYDAVAYFTQGKPVKGSPKFSFKWKNAKWLFSKQEHLDAFKRSPESYAPQYGGYCAFGCSNGYKAPTEPDAWTITGGRLYLNYNKDVRTEWTRNRDERIRKADQVWPVIRNKG